MISKELKEFREYYAISIHTFLKECFVKNDTNEKRNWRVKHSEISFLPLTVPVSLKFAFRYEELVANGKILIVKDDFGKYQAYVNPKIIICLNKKRLLEQELKELKKPFHNLQELKSHADQINQVSQSIESIEEDERIINHFLGKDAIEYSRNVCSDLEEVGFVRTQIVEK